MDALIGKDKKFCIRKDALFRIEEEIKTGHCETGGILGFDREGVLSEFQLDEVQNPNLYEYYPNTAFLSNVINGIWLKKEIKFAGFVHSHLHNNEISRQDVDYCRAILRINDFMECVLAGVVDLSRERDCIKWYAVTADSVSVCEAKIVTSI